MCGIAGVLTSLFLATAPFTDFPYRHVEFHFEEDFGLIAASANCAIGHVHDEIAAIALWWIPLPEEVVRQIRELDAESFEVRQAASRRLRAICRESTNGAGLNVQFELLLGNEQTSAEVRAQLEALLQELPPPPPLNLSPPRIDRLLAGLDADSFSVRAAASAQLEWLGREPASRPLLLEAIKARLADPKLTLSDRRQIEPLWERVHGAWLLEEASQWKLPPVPPEKIQRWIDILTRDPPADLEGPWLPHEVATRELLDLLARPDTCPATSKELARRLSDASLGFAATTRLRAVHDWTRHLVANEFWQSGRRRLTQYIYLPDPPRGNRPAEDVDHANDCVLHCATDDILPRGDYVLGEAESARDSDCFWYSVNLPTPKRRMAYEFGLHNRTDRERLAEITAKTMQRYVDFEKPLLEFSLLEQLDPEVISRLAGPYLAATRDVARRGDSSGSLGVPSQHGLFCLWLGAHGTRAAIPGLIDAVVHDRLFKPDKDCPLNLPWIAALMIAERDPSPDAEAWLAEQSTRTEQLDLAHPTDLGATAAAALLRRRHERPDDFGLEESGSPALAQLHLTGYRIQDAKTRTTMLRW